MSTSTHMPEKQEPSIEITFVKNESDEGVTHIHASYCKPANLLDSIGALIISFLINADDKDKAMLTVLEVVHNYYLKYLAGEYKPIPLNEEK